MAGETLLLLLSFGNVSAPVGGGQASGAAAVGVLHAAIVGGGPVLAGQSEWLVTYTNPSRLTYHQFTIADRVYVFSFALDRYLPRTVKGIYLYGTQVYYDCGFDELVAESLVVSLEEYRQQQGRTAYQTQRQMQQRIRSLVPPVPVQFHVTGGLVKSITGGGP